MSLDMETIWKTVTYLLEYVVRTSLRICCKDYIENEAYGYHSAYVDLIRFLSKHRRLSELLESIPQFLEEIKCLSISCQNNTIIP